MMKMKKSLKIKAYIVSNDRKFLDFKLNKVDNMLELIL